MDETEEAKRVWREAQATMLAASNRLLEDLDNEQLRVAREAYRDAVAECAAAKSFYDETRRMATSNTLRCRPKAG